MAARRSSKLAASTGNRPQNTTGIAGRKPGSGSSTGLRSSVMVSPTRVSATSLIEAVMAPISPGTELVDRRELGREHAGAVDVIGGVGAHHADALALLQDAVDDAHQHDHAEIGVVPAVDQQRLERRVAVAFRRRQAGDDGFQHLGHVLPGLGGNLDRVRGVEPDHVLDLLLDRSGSAAGRSTLLSTGTISWPASMA